MDQRGSSGSIFGSETAIEVVDDTVDVVSEGHWRLFAPEGQLA